jgi:hypothetical protein
VSARAEKDSLLIVHDAERESGRSTFPVALAYVHNLVRPQRLYDCY